MMAKEAAPAAMKVVPRDIVDTMHAGLAGQTNAVLMQRYGISYNTWRKVRAGDAIRRSVAERLERRLQDTDATARTHGSADA